jgi:thiamine biosynthesis lipoprotein
MLHHIVDPRTGQPAGGPWRTVSVAAVTCADANAAATAAIVAGSGALDWLAEAGLPARLVSHDGTVTRAGGWPAGGNEQLIFPPGSRVYGAPPAGNPR